MEAYFTCPSEMQLIADKAYELWLKNFGYPLRQTLHRDENQTRKCFTRMDDPCTLAARQFPVSACCEIDHVTLTCGPEGDPVRTADLRRLLGTRFAPFYIIETKAQDSAKHPRLVLSLWGCGLRL